MMTGSRWVRTTGQELMQGDYLPGCLVTSFDPDFSEAGSDTIGEVIVHTFDVVVLTQSCDLDNNRARFVAVCPAFSLSVFQTYNTKFQNKDRERSLIKNQIQGLYSMPSPIPPSTFSDWLIVDFHEIYSIPYKYLARHATAIAPRWRLQSPYREHLSRSFGDFYSRVALPEDS